MARAQKPRPPPRGRLICGQVLPLPRCPLTVPPPLRARQRPNGTKRRTSQHAKARKSPQTISRANGSARLVSVRYRLPFAHLPVGANVICRRSPASQSHPFLCFSSPVTRALLPVTCPLGAPAPGLTPYGCCSTQTRSTAIHGATGWHASALSSPAFEPHGAD